MCDALPSSSTATNLLLAGVLRRLRGHLHTLLVRLVTLHDRTRSDALLDLLVLLDKGAAGAPVGCAAIAGTVALDAEALPDLVSLEHRIAIIIYISCWSPYEDKKSELLTPIHSQLGTLCRTSTDNRC
jgi:hypothetical protein